MKKWILTALTLALAACGDNGGGGGGGGAVTTATPTTTVTTPLSNTCVNGTTNCNGNIYYTTPGLYGYQYSNTYNRYNYTYDYTTYFNNYGFCDCPAGYAPIYNNTYGLGCIQQRYLQPYSGFFLTWNWNNSTTPWGYGTISTGPYGINGSINYGFYYDPTIPTHYGPGQFNYRQVSNIPRATCPRTLTQSCLLDQANTCGNGATCRQVLPSSNLGVCVSPN